MRAASSWRHRLNRGQKAVAAELEALLVFARLDLVGHAAYEVEAVERRPGAAHADQSARLQRPAVTHDIEASLPGHGVGPLRGFAHADQDGFGHRTLGEVV